MGMNRKRLVFLSRLLVIITIAYILILTPGREYLKFWGYAFIAFYLFTNLIIHYLPDRYFERAAFFYAIVLCDCLLIVSGIYLSGMEGSDLYLIFFVIVCLATLGSELKNLVIASFLFVIIYGWLLYQQGLLQGDMAVSYYLRLPFILVVTLFLGYIVELQAKTHKDRLLESEKRYRSFVDNLPIGVYQQAAGDNSRFLLMNKAFENLFGYGRKELLESDTGIIYSDQKQKQEIDRRLDQGQSIEGRPMNLIRRDGSVFNATVWARKYTLDKEDIIEGVIIDITKLKEVERALEESKERLRLAGKASYDLVYEFRKDDNHLLWFGDIDAKLGYESGEISQDRVAWHGLIHPEDAGRLQHPVNGQQEDGDVNVCEYRIKHKDGSWRYWSDHYLPVRDDQGGIVKYIGVCTDITEKKEMEHQLQQAQKMEAIGVLAGGVAHNFNNALMGIVGPVSDLLMDKDPSDPDYELLEQIKESVREASSMTSNLLGFARGGAYEILPLDLNNLIEKENHMFSKAKKNITIHADLAENLRPVAADKSQIQQVLLNLYLNAAQAMPESGTGDIFVRTENIRLDKKKVEPHELQPGDYVKITVRDTGCGMDDQVMGKIFDPFFTTKKTGSGTGLGLSFVYGVMKNYAGFIEIDSNIAEGSTFSLYFPATTKKTDEKIRPESAAVIKEGSGTILVVDDEEMVLKSCARLLKRLKYQVLTAGEGREALNLYETRKDDIDLVMLDILMPDMSGGMIFDKLREIDPAVKVLLCSGFSLNDQIRQILARGGRGFIQKPFEIQDISLKIKELIEEE
ncbi:MAG: PAS domain S-box protein [Desulfosudaceae bacterium]